MRNRLVHAAKNSATVEELCLKLGKKEADAEKVWSSLIKKASGAEDFLTKNECARLMKEHYEDGDFVALGETRKEYIKAVVSLQLKGFLYCPTRDEVAEFIGIAG